MKVEFTQQAMAILGALLDDDGREARDLVRRLRSATTPVGIRIGIQTPRYEACLSHKGVLIQYEVRNGVATVVRVVSAARRAQTASDHEATSASEVRR